MDEHRIVTLDNDNLWNRKAISWTSPGAALSHRPNSPTPPIHA